MTIPKVDTVKRGEDRLYLIPDGTSVIELPGVTTVIGKKHKPPIAPWFSREAAAEAYHQRDLLAHLSLAETVDLLKGAPYRASRRAADLGTAVHDVAEALDRGEPVTEVSADIVHPVRGLLSYRKAFTPVPLEIEVTVANLTHGYAGTLDAIVRIGTGQYLVDYKTSRAPYPDYGVQLSAYQQGEFIVDPDGTRRPMPRIDGVLIVHLPKQEETRWSVRLMDVGQAEFDVFLALLTVWRWDTDRAKSVVSRPIRTPEGLPPPF